MEDVPSRRGPEGRQSICALGMDEFDIQTRRPDLRSFGLDCSGRLT